MSKNLFENYWHFFVIKSGSWVIWIVIRKISWTKKYWKAKRAHLGSNKDSKLYRVLLWSTVPFHTTVTYHTNQTFEKQNFSINLVQSKLKTVFPLPAGGKLIREIPKRYLHIVGKWSDHGLHESLFPFSKISGHGSISKKIM